MDFAVQFCFCCKFSFHGKLFKSSWRWHDFPGPITILLLCIATNEIASFSFWQQITSNGFFRVRWIGQSCRSLFLYCIKQIDSMLPCVCSVNRSQRTSKCGKNISDTLGYRLMCHFFFLTTFWRHPWSITEQTHSNMESIC